MQRVIKFRLWDERDKAYRPIRNIGFNPNRQITGVAAHEGESWENLGGSGYILEQFTGLKDAKGKEIYEGDIVRTFNKEIGVIDFSDAAFVIGIYEEGELQREEIHTEQDAWEVIGNIYQTPELLKV